ncbi:protein transport protein Sec16A isoform X1 [Lates japonicus]|uniref:Protein transport protein Sec16A isoform X1 n=1 Tax=Lates japonicus TaxID=270547 RepID=A0AAD3RI94_LATJO|nr:protein transport protein Sec16A isoform X1 [Lates japonicus]
MALFGCRQSPNEANLIDFNNEPLLTSRQEGGADALSINTFADCPRECRQEQALQGLLLFGRQSGIDYLQCRLDNSYSSVQQPQLWPDQPSPPEPCSILEMDGPPHNNPLMNSLLPGPPPQGVQLMPQSQIPSQLPPQDPGFALLPSSLNTTRRGNILSTCPFSGHMPHMETPTPEAPEMQPAQPISSSHKQITPQMDFYDHMANMAQGALRTTSESSHSLCGKSVATQLSNRPLHLRPFQLRNNPAKKRPKVKKDSRRDGSCCLALEPAAPRAVVLLSTYSPGKRVGVEALDQQPLEAAEEDIRGPPCLMAHSLGRQVHQQEVGSAPVVWVVSAQYQC